ncbi:hypothetical protein J5N97_018465 [Dioscorea zingiberensis]|uniref:Large ribosomal subunit protein uL18c n=1 Tax=Dioscorea zingiberensis TaxID=325984 RepID=A0A9D5HHA4_9LILI|nr:hypothetical protein J5N97_018465 [Dioscorea zingiberensis]
MSPTACLWSTAAPLSSSVSSVRGSDFPFLRLIPAGANVASIRQAATFPSIFAKALTRRQNRDARHQRVRHWVEGTPERPRLCVFRSNKHLYAQVIDDTKMHTLVSASTMQKPIADEFDYSCGPTIEVAKKVGEAIAKSCLEKGILKVAFDRGGYPYHGRIEALADAARENGLQF